MARDSPRLCHSDSSQNPKKTLLVKPNNPERQKINRRETDRTGLFHNLGQLSDRPSSCLQNLLPLFAVHERCKGINRANRGEMITQQCFTFRGRKSAKEKRPRKKGTGSRIAR